MRAALGAALAACLLGAGCGSADDRAASTATPPPAPTPTPPVNGPEAQPGGAGDEQPARQRVPLTISDRGLAPRLVKVSAFLGIELVVRNTTGREQVVALGRHAVSIPAGRTGRLALGGLRRGRYTIDAYAAGRATLVSSLDEP